MVKHSNEQINVPISHEFLAATSLGSHHYKTPLQVFASMSHFRFGSLLICGGLLNFNGELLDFRYDITQ